jgi:hypothetical protein
MKWEKIGTTVYATGERTVTYAKGDLRIESRKHRIPHANGEGYWMHTNYVLIWPDGYSRDFYSLRLAMTAGNEDLEKRGKEA